MQLQVRCPRVDEVKDGPEHLLLHPLHHQPVLGGEEVRLVVVVVPLGLDVVPDHVGEHPGDRGEPLLVCLQLSGPAVEDEVWRVVALEEVLVPDWAGRERECQPATQQSVLTPV